MSERGRHPAAAQLGESGERLSTPKSGKPSAAFSATNDGNRPASPATPAGPAAAPNAVDYAVGSIPLPGQPDAAQPPQQRGDMDGDKKSERDILRRRADGARNGQISSGQTAQPDAPSLNYQNAQLDALGKAKNQSLEFEGLAAGQQAASAGKSDRKDVDRGSAQQLPQLQLADIDEPVIKRVESLGSVDQPPEKVTQRGMQVPQGPGAVPMVSSHDIYHLDTQNSQPEPVVPLRYRLNAKVEPDQAQKALELGGGGVPNDLASDGSRQGLEAELGEQPQRIAPVAGGMPAQPRWSEFGFQNSASQAAQPAELPQSIPAAKPMQELPQSNPEPSQNVANSQLTAGVKSKPGEKSASGADSDNTNLFDELKKTYDEKPLAGRAMDINSVKRNLSEDPQSNGSFALKVPADVVKRAELGDHSETINTDRPDSNSAYGTSDAKMFHNLESGDGAASGGSTGGATLEEMITAGAGRSPGSGGGWGGKRGANTGKENAEGQSSFGRRMMTKKAPDPAKPGTTESETRLSSNLDNLDDKLSASNFGPPIKVQRHGGAKLDNEAKINSQIAVEHMAPRQELSVLQTEQVQRAEELNKQLAAQGDHMAQQSAGRIAQLTTVENAQSQTVLQLSNSNAFAQTPQNGGNAGAANNYALTLPDQNAAQNNSGDQNKAALNFNPNYYIHGGTAAHNDGKRQDQEKRDKEDESEKNLKSIADVTAATAARDLADNERQEEARESKRLAEDNAKMHNIITKLQMAATVKHEAESGEIKPMIEGGNGVTELDSKANFKEARSKLEDALNAKEQSQKGQTKDFSRVGSECHVPRSK